MLTILLSLLALILLCSYIVFLYKLKRSNAWITNGFLFLLFALGLSDTATLAVVNTELVMSVFDIDVRNYSSVVLIIFLKALHVPPYFAGLNTCYQLAMISLFRLFAVALPVKYFVFNVLENAQRLALPGFVLSLLIGIYNVLDPVTCGYMNPVTLQIAACSALSRNNSSVTSGEPLMVQFITYSFAFGMLLFVVCNMITASFLLKRSLKIAHADSNRKHAWQAQGQLHVHNGLKLKAERNLLLITLILGLMMISILVVFGQNTLFGLDQYSSNLLRMSVVTVLYGVNPWVYWAISEEIRTHTLPQCHLC